MSGKSYTFVEPHFMGGHAVVYITEEQILTFMQNHEIKKKFPEIPDDELIYCFCVTHWCREEKPDARRM